MLPYELIKKKRDGLRLDREEIEYLIREYVAGTIPDYQMSALLMAVFFRGMETGELAVWTEAMVNSGDVISFSGDGPYLDKHSTGGIGDKVSLPLAALLACNGIHVPMISGRGLGHTGGTLDKLESIPGFRTNLSVEEFKRQVDEVGCCIIGQTASLAPADKKLYALRDVTATVDSIPLIASSILSKKKASGISGLLMDVKTGSGAFMTSRESARELAATLVSGGGALGLTVRAFITEMGRPLGAAVGNSLEVVESIEILQGRGPEDSTALVVRFAAEMIMMAGLERERARAMERVERTVQDGSGLMMFAKMIEAQGGDPKVVEDTWRLPIAAGRLDFCAKSAGCIRAMDCEKIGQAIVALGGGRKKIDDIVDPSVGLVVHRKVGDSVSAGEPLATIYYAGENRLDEALGLLGRVYSFAEEAVESPELIHEML